MSHKLSSALKQPFYLWLLGIYPILHLYSENLGLVKDREVIYVCAGMLAATTLAFLLAKRVIPCKYKTAFMLSICSLVFSLSGHVYVQIFIPRSLFVWTSLVLIAMAISLLILWRTASSQLLERVTPTLNLVLLALLAIPATNIVSSYLSKSINVPPVSAFADSPTRQNAIPKVQDSTTHPDIYYIIPDGYPSDSWLKNEMNFDNSKFTAALEERGFTVVKHAKSNYGATLTSLASTLNMQYFDNNPSPYKDVDYLRISIADNAVARLFQELGYTYIQFLSGYLLPSPIADINREFTPQGTAEITISRDMLPISKLENRQLPGRRHISDLSHFYKRSFLSLYVDTTFFRILASQLQKLNYRDTSAPYDLLAPERFLATIDEVKSIASMPEATFAIVHLLKPHGPVVFDGNGETIDPISLPNHQEFFAEFSFVNSAFLQMIDSIIESSKTLPVIIFQADHGSTYGDIWQPEARLTHFDIYAAYYLPEPYSVSVPGPYTLINSFPLILNEVFGTEFEYQPNRLMELLNGYDAPFEQVDVTFAYAFNNP